MTKKSVYNSFSWQKLPYTYLFTNLFMQPLHLGGKTPLAPTAIIVLNPQGGSLIKVTSLSKITTCISISRCVTQILSKWSHNKHYKRILTSGFSYTSDIVSTK